MKKYLINIGKIVVFALIIIANSACEEYLDRSPIIQLDPDNFFRNESELKSATFGMYKFLYDRSSIEMSHFTDDGYGFKNSTGMSFTYGEHTAYDSKFLESWRRSYQGIGQANLVLTYVDESPADEEVKNACKGEAYFMRAFYYFDLAYLFGDVPLIVMQPSVTGDIFPSRTPRAEVIAQILDDLDNATDLLPVNTDKGRASRGAAMGLKA
ncbi:MAG: RagB/SusD family nutrient uptake outer membrane protein, partial [Bacteroidales bacterium]|nr:RagB/SusD family nutrient uptake outer membrane protein [Bacteroidales bacterium]